MENCCATDTKIQITAINIKTIMKGKRFNPVHPFATRHRDEGKKLKEKLKSEGVTDAKWEW